MCADSVSAAPATRVPWGRRSSPSAPSSIAASPPPDRRSSRHCSTVRTSGSPASSCKYWSLQRTPVHSSPLRKNASNVERAEKRKAQGAAASDVRLASRARSAGPVSTTHRARAVVRCTPKARCCARYACRCRRCASSSRMWLRPSSQAPRRSQAAQAGASAAEGSAPASAAQSSAPAASPPSRSAKLPAN
eukprot:662674-Prorocentrum_minimum.AAC.1